MPGLCTTTIALREQTYQDTGKGLSYADCTNDLPHLKRTYPWLKDADSQVLQQALKNTENPPAPLVSKNQRLEKSRPRPDGRRGPA
jgi:putative transposase